MTQTIPEEPKLLGRQSPAVEQYASLLIRLHEQMHDGNEEGAEATRAQMDSPGILLDENEIRFVKGLSSDLYMLVGEEMLRSGGYADAEYMAAFTNAWQHQSYLTALDLLRKKERPFGEDQVAVYRAMLYDRLGLQNASRQFLSFAAELSPRFQNVAKPYPRLPKAKWDEHVISNAPKQTDVGLTKHTAIGSTAGVNKHQVGPSRVLLASLLLLGSLALGICLFAVKSEATEAQKTLGTSILTAIVAYGVGYASGGKEIKSDKE